MTIYRIHAITSGSVIGMINWGYFDFPIYPRGLGSVYKDGYFTQADLDRHPKLQSLYLEGKLIREELTDSAL